MWIISHEYKIINTVTEVNNMKNEILIYNLPDGGSNVEVYLNEDDIWMTQLSLADMFQTSKANITMHIQNIYKEGELQEDRTSSL